MAVYTMEGMVHNITYTSFKKLQSYSSVIGGQLIYYTAILLGLSTMLSHSGNSVTYSFLQVRQYKYEHMINKTYPDYR
jgi:hypothetical protein